MKLLSRIKSLYFYSLTGTVGFTIILIAFILSIFAYLIIPDNTTNANHQIPELALSPIGTKSLILRKKLTPQNKKDGFSILNGSSETYLSIPVQQFDIIDNTVHYTNLKGNALTAALTDFKVSNKEAFTKQCVENKYFPFGTDKYGRDIFSRLILGLRISLFVGFFAVCISIILGLTIGLAAGYFGGLIDNILLFVINTVWSIPTILLVFAIVLALGRGVYVIFLAVGLTLWIEIARVVRGQTLALKNETFIQAAKSMGFSSLRTIVKHILPNVIAPVIVLAAANFAIAILVEAGLSYLGFGVKPPVPSLGNILNENYGYALSGKLYMAVLPALFIMILVLSFNFVSYTTGDWLESNKTKTSIE